MKSFLKLLFILTLAGNFTTTVVYAQTVELGNGTAISVFSPINRSNDYSVYEVIYLSSQIGISGDITHFGIQRHDGSNVDSIENVSIYMKQTALTSLAAGNYDTTSFTLVYDGSFPNDSGAGWREVILDNIFSYTNTSNLQVLISKGYQLAVANTPVTPRWIYTNTSPDPARARRYFGANPISSATALSTTTFTSNARLTFLATGVIELQTPALNVFPNPAAGNISFTFDSSVSGSKLKITNALGEVVYENVLTNETVHEVILEKSGIYFYSLLNRETNKPVFGKVVVTK